MDQKRAVICRTVQHLPGPTVAYPSGNGNPEYGRGGYLPNETRPGDSEPAPIHIFGLSLAFGPEHDCQSALDRAWSRARASAAAHALPTIPTRRNELLVPVASRQGD